MQGRDLVLMASSNDKSKFVHSCTGNIICIIANGEEREWKWRTARTEILRSWTFESLLFFELVNMIQYRFLDFKFDVKYRWQH